MHEAITDELYNSVKEIVRFQEAINNELKERDYDTGTECIEIRLFNKQLTVGASAMAWEALENFLADLKKITVSELEEWLNE